MNVPQFLSAANYPIVWIKHSLASGAFFEQQATLFAAKHGSKEPRGGTEHWRYGSFLHWLHQSIDAERLQHLLEAALADPDPPMAGNVLKAIASHPLATNEQLEVAVGAVAENTDYFVSEGELRQLFAGRRRNPNAA